MIIRKFGEDNAFNAISIDSYCLLVCYGGTAYAKKFRTFKEFEELIKPVLFCDEKGVIEYCKDNDWFNYNYYTDEILDYSTGVCVQIDVLSKTIGFSYKNKPSVFS